MPDASPLMLRLNQTLLSLVTHHTESVPTETCTIFKPFVASQPLTGVGGLTSSQASPAKFSRVTPERTMTRPLYKTAQTNPVGPTLNCVSSLPAGVEIAVQRKPSGEELLTPKSQTLDIYPAMGSNRPNNKSAWWSVGYVGTTNCHINKRLLCWIFVQRSNSTPTVQSAISTPNNSSESPKHTSSHLQPTIDPLNLNPNANHHPIAKPLTAILSFQYYALGFHQQTSDAN
uniref:Uncharacterized protein n=1 Tax=Glossina pallidipes TaxID=7398 RepID=A0A1B0A720_GLOPL